MKKRLRGVHQVRKKIQKMGVDEGLYTGVLCIQKVRLSIGERLFSKEKAW